MKDAFTKQKESLKAPNLKASSISPTLVSDIRSRLSFTPDKLLSQERLSRVLNVSYRTIARWESGTKPDQHSAIKLARLQKALDMIGDMIDREYLLDFFEQHHPLLMGLRPIDLLDTDDGANLLFHHLEAAQTGAFS
ncbi:MAG TPA: helix-turn-helix domain-containing protein [Thermodesulfovibrionia bacterium]|nr:helix-turn-helix domain-containing protein [Thermodesulfovibrionia bacterium]